MSRTQVALIGAGQWGINYVAALATSPEFALRAICDLKMSAISAAVARFSMSGGIGALSTEQDASVIMADPRIAAVIIATPAASHVALATAALRAGKDVLVEKPIAQTMGEIDALEEAAGAARIVMAGHLLRFAPAFRQLIASLHAGLIGEVVHCEIERSNDGGVRADEDVIWSLGTHDISLLQALLRQAPATIEASNVAMDRETNSLAQVSLRLGYEGGATARLFLSRLTGKRVRSWGVRGTKGQLAVVADAHGALSVLYAPGEPSDATPAWQPLPVAQTPNETPLRLQLAHFARAMATRVAPLTDLHEARDVVNVGVRAGEAASIAFAKKWPGNAAVSS